MRARCIFEGVVATIFDDPHAQEDQGESRVYPIFFPNWSHHLPFKAPALPKM